jgi:hypothetical protein
MTASAGSQLVLAKGDLCGTYAYRGSDSGGVCHRSHARCLLDDLRHDMSPVAND